MRCKGVVGGSDGKESACNVADLSLIPVSGRSPGEENGNPLQLFLPREPHGQRTLLGYSPWNHKELDTTERLRLSLFIFMFAEVCLGAWAVCPLDSLSGLKDVFLQLLGRLPDNRPQLSGFSGVASADEGAPSRGPLNLKLVNGMRVGIKFYPSCSDLGSL